MRVDSSTPITKRIEAALPGRPWRGLRWIDTGGSYAMGHLNHILNVGIQGRHVVLNRLGDIRAFDLTPQEHWRLVRHYVRYRRSAQRAAQRQREQDIPDFIRVYRRAVESADAFLASIDPALVAAAERTVKETIDDK